MAIKLVTDSTSYIEEKTRKELDITTVNLSVNFPDESFDETKVDYDYFYNKIHKEQTIPTSSQPPLGTIYETFKEIVARGEQILGIFLSAQMSGTYETAMRAREMALEEYPEARIELLDSKMNCMALGLQVIEAAVAAQAGKTMEEVMEIAFWIRERVHFFFVPASLEYLIKGGRIGGAAAILGSLLQIKPILYVNDGMTDMRDRVRGGRAALKCLQSLLHEDAKKFGLKHLLVHNIHDPEKGNALAQNLSQIYNREVLNLAIGPVIGCHVGPGTVGIVYCTEN